MSRAMRVYTEALHFALHTYVGAYLIWIMAEDKAGNGSVVGPFVPGEDVERRVYLPLVMREDNGG
jgi:hypothetical protein